MIAGFWLWQVKSVDEAVKWLTRAPFDDGTEIEIRSVFANEDFGANWTRERQAKEERWHVQAAANAER